MEMSPKTELLMISRNPGSAVEELRVMPFGKQANRHAFMLWLRWAEVSLDVCLSPFLGSTNARTQAWPYSVCNRETPDRRGPTQLLRPRQVLPKS